MSIVLTRRLSIAGMMLLALTASALPAPNTAAASPPTGRHCVVKAARPGLSDPAGETCYRTFTEAVAAATGGRIADAPADSTVAFHDRDLQKRLNATTGNRKHPVTAGRAATGYVLIGIEYEHIGLGGRSRLFYADAPCTTTTDDADWGFADLRRTDFNDTISSFLTYNNCWVDHYEHIWYGGDHTGYQPSQYYVGDWMNDRTSALIWS